MGVELFGSQGSRSPLVNWYLHELDTPFEMAPLDRYAKETYDMLKRYLLCVSCACVGTHNI